MIAGLAFGAFDFMVTPDHEWFALECNPEGQWDWIEENTGLPIADAIARHLLSTAHPRAVNLGYFRPQPRTLTAFSVMRYGV
jgi:hypothetical protein